LDLSFKPQTLRRKEPNKFEGVGCNSTKSGNGIYLHWQIVLDVPAFFEQLQKFTFIKWAKRKQGINLVIRTLLSSTVIQESYMAKTYLFKNLTNMSRWYCMTTPSRILEDDKEKKQKAVRLAGAIWIYGSILAYGQPPVPEIKITMPIPLVYDYKEDFGGRVFRGKDGYFTLQIKAKDEVRKALEAIKDLIGGVEEEQIQILLDILDAKQTRKSKERDEKLEILFKKWESQKQKLDEWMKKFVMDHKDEPIRPVPIKIWDKTDRYGEYMEKNSYKIPKMLSLEEVELLEEAKRHAQSKSK
jgi:hypothetical protein